MLLTLVLVALAVQAVQAVPAGAAQRFRPRIGHALGLMPKAGEQEIAVGSNLPVVYHGGSVMRDVTMHTIFWAPSGRQFDPAPSPQTLSYESLIQQFFTDAAHDSGKTTNSFSILDQYGDHSGPGSYELNYNPAADSFNDTDPYPVKSKQCASPAGVETCVTDLEVQDEINRIINEHDRGGRGLHDTWYVFLPPDVDECTSPGVCATTEFAGYHSLSNVGHGAVIYVVVPDIQVEEVPSPGSDPEGNPEAESAIDTATHELVESITNPEGNGWMDPNGFEIADDCENPEDGPPLGYAANGSPYNEVMNGHLYLTQMMWSNAAGGCVQRSVATSDGLPMPTIHLTQFSSSVSGDIGTAQPGVTVELGLVRTDDLVATAHTTTRANGSWGPVSLGGPVRHAFGDDRDEVDVVYGPGGPSPDVIATGDGGNPFTEAGWTGWFDLDNGYVIRNHGIALSPCGQTGTLTLTVGDKVTTPPPIDLCETETDLAIVNTTAISAGTRLSMSSEDDRAVSDLNPRGALVKLTVPLGEPGSESALGNDDVLFEPSGFPLCTANLEAQTTTCTGLVPDARYTLTRNRSHVVMHATAGVAGTARFVGARITGGDALILRNHARRTLTTLHVAHLRVAIRGAQTVLSGGRCEPDDYYGRQVTSPPTGQEVGAPGATGTGKICPDNGHAAGLSTANIEQTDDRSGGLTRTEVPGLQSMSPNSGATLYGAFVAQSQPSLPGPDGSFYGAAHATVALTITGAASRRRVVFVPDVAVGRGVRVRSLPAGAYDAKWVVRDVNGDTRTVLTRFVEAG